MRFLFLNHNLVGSGTYFRAFHFGRQLAARGHQVQLVTTSRESRFRLSSHYCDGVEVIEAPDWMPGRARTGWDPYNTLVRRSLVRQSRYDVVHAFDSRPAVIYPALAAVAASKALFVMDWADWWGRGGWIHDRSGWLVRTAFGPIETWYEEAFRTRAHGMTVISRALADRSRSLGVAADRIKRLPFGCDPAARVEQMDRANARALLGVGANARIVLHAGVLTQGDLVFLLAAFERVRDSMPLALLVLAGRTGMRVRTPPLGVTVTGALNDDQMDAWTAAANVCVVPCRDTVGNRGRWPSKVNAYLTHERAVVMPRVGDAAALVERVGAGWVSEPNVESFTAALEDALRDDGRADDAGRRGGEAARTELSWARLTDELLDFYERVNAAVSRPL